MILSVEIEHRPYFVISRRDGGDYFKDRWGPVDIGVTDDEGLRVG